jgi:succinate dehydrogenase flavin-adding protein (antitoxin of CptAB toxin-antitoxin module)
MCTGVERRIQTACKLRGLFALDSYLHQFVRRRCLAYLCVCVRVVVCV